MIIFTFIYQFSGFTFRSILHYPSSKKEVIDFLTAYQIDNKERFDEKLIKDIVKRHVIQQLFINDSFTQLFGRKSKKKEHERNILFTIMSCIYDTIMDDGMMEVHELDKMLSDPEQYQCIGFYDKALKDVYLKLLCLIDEKEVYKNVIKSVHRAQIDSLMQKDRGLSMDEIIFITKRKGGYSLLAAQFLLDVHYDKELSSCWYELGALVQMMDDLYDIHEDLQQGISTFCNVSQSYSFIKGIYDDQVKVLSRTINDLALPDCRKKRFKVSLSLIPALGYVALDNIAKNLVSGDQLPNLMYVPRKRLITDMEKYSNLIRLMKYCFKFSSRE